MIGDRHDNGSSDFTSACENAAVVEQCSVLEFRVTYGVVFVPHPSLSSPQMLICGDENVKDHSNPHSAAGYARPTRVGTGPMSDIATQPLLGWIVPGVGRLAWFVAFRVSQFAGCVTLGNYRFHDKLSLTNYP